MAKKLTQRMINLGANLFHKIGLGDYQHDFGYEGEFDPWTQQLWPELVKFGLPQGEMLSASLLPSVYIINEAGSAVDTLSLLPAPHGAHS
jgi:hypothetical protein